MDIIELLDSPIAYHRAFVHFGGVTGAVLLSQAIYWQRRTISDDGFFYKIADEWEKETGLTQREQATARKRLVEVGILEEIRRGNPCKLFYRINSENLIRVLRETKLNESAKLDSTNAQNKDQRKRETLHTEITSEITSEITTCVARTNISIQVPVLGWESLFDENVKVDSALTRVVTAKLKEYGIEDVIKTIELYSWAIQSKDSWITHKVSMFDFFQNDSKEISFVKFFHHTKETLTVTQKKESSGRSGNFMDQFKGGK